MQAMIHVAHNRPFWEYILSKVLLLVAFHLHGVMSLYYFKYVLLAENSVQANGVRNLCSMVVVALYMRLIRKLMDRASVRVLFRNVAVFFGICS